MKFLNKLNLRSHNKVEACSVADPINRHDTSQLLLMTINLIINFKCTIFHRSAFHYGNS